MTFTAAPFVSFERVRRRSANLDFTFIDMSDPKAVEKAMRPNTRMVWVETPSNPLLKLIDLEAVARIARAHNAISVSDNTFASPCLQRPIEFGFDMVIHSATKYLNGHSDMVGGVIVSVRTKRIGGSNCFPAKFGRRDCRTVRQLPRHAWIEDARFANGATLRERDGNCAMAHDRTKGRVREVSGLKEHPQHALAKKQMRGFGGMVTIVLKTDLEGTRRFLENTHLFALAESLGGVESLINHPAIMTHGSIPPDMRAALGITDSLVRLSVGVEDVDDRIGDLQDAFAAI